MDFLKLNSLEIFPLSDRLKGGKFNRVFNSKNFDLLLKIIERYHYALKEAELNIFKNEYNEYNVYQLNKYTYNTLLPKDKRLPIESGHYNGISKLDYYNFKSVVTEYHKALEYAEKRIKRFNTVKSFIENFKF